MQVCNIKLVEYYKKYIIITYLPITDKQTRTYRYLPDYSPIQLTVFIKKIVLNAFYIHECTKIHRTTADIFANTDPTSSTTRVQKSYTRHMFRKCTCYMQQRKSRIGSHINPAAPLSCLHRTKFDTWSNYRENHSNRPPIHRHHPVINASLKFLQS